MPCCEISDCAQMSKTIIAVRHFGLGGRESLETAVMTNLHHQVHKIYNLCTTHALLCLLYRLHNYVRYVRNCTLFTMQYLS